MGTTLTVGSFRTVDYAHFPGRGWIMNDVFRFVGLSEAADSSLWTLGAVAAATAVVVGSYVYRRHERRRDEPWPVVAGWRPLTGHTHQVKSMAEIMDTMEAWADEYGKEAGCFSFYIGTDRQIAICRPDLALQVLKHRPKKVERNDQIRESANCVGAQGVFTAGGEQWRVEHKLVAAALNNSNVNEYLVSLRKAVNRLITKWDSLRLEGAVAIGHDLSSLASDSIAMVGMGRDYDFLNHPTSQVAEDVQATMKAVFSRAFSPVRYWRLPFIGQYIDGYGGAIKRTNKLVNTVIEEHESTGGDASQRTFLQKLYDEMQAEKSHLSRKRVVGNIVTLFLAGSDTTSRSLTTALYLLGEHADWQQELRTETQGVDIDSLSLPELFSTFPRIKSFLHELHRYYGTPLLGVQNQVPIEFNGTTIPARTNMLLLTRYINLQESDDLPHGPDNVPASEFSHRRWLVKEADGTLSAAWPKKAVTNLSFGHGVRSCPGKTYSEALSVLALAHLLQAFDWTLEGDTSKVKMVVDTTMVPNIDVKLLLNKRS